MWRERKRSARSKIEEEEDEREASRGDDDAYGGCSSSLLRTTAKNRLQKDLVGVALEDKTSHEERRTECRLADEDALTNAKPWGAHTAHPSCM